MRKKKKSEQSVFDPANMKISGVIHEFVQLHREFHEYMNRKSSENLLEFFSNEEKRKAIIEHGQFNPHPETHQSIERDIEALETALKSWEDETVGPEVVVKYLNDLRYWLVADSLD